MREELMNHTFCFIVGAHHSGTSLLHLLLGFYANVSIMFKTGVPEDEGLLASSLVDCPD